MTRDEFILECSKIKTDITDELYEKLYFHFETLVKWNKKFNLTSITEEKNVFLKHFYDSLTIVKSNLIKPGISLCDFGTGAGFPGMVLAIVFENISVTLIESNNKKCEFLSFLKNELKLKNVQIINARMEECSKEFKETFDIITCRAVSSLGAIMEVSVQAIKVGGYFIALKSRYEEEIKKINDDLGLSLQNIINFNLPIEKSERNILIYKKDKVTPEKYPRNYSTIIKTYK